MPALWIAHVTVTDEDAYGKYAKLAGPAIAAHGGSFLARGGRFVQLEGKERPRNVVARFASVEDAIAIGVVEEDGCCPPFFIQLGFVAVTRKEKLIFPAFKATTTGNSTEHISPLKVVMSDP